MNTLRWTAALAFVLSLSSVAHADDAAYCQALAATYQKYFVKDSGHYRDAGPVEGNVAVDQCRAGNLAGIPVLERRLRAAKIELPARG